MSATVNYIIS